jgi:cation:H+ antiporter
VVLGSNLFNLAALLGLSAVVAGGVRIRREPLILDAAVGLSITACAALLLPGFVPSAVAAVPAVLIFVLYVLVLGHFHGLARRFWPAAFEISIDQEQSTASWAPVALIPLGVAGVLVGSLAMVRSALQLSAVWHLNGWLLGTVVLAGLTSLPNLYIALHFARAGRGAALVSAAMNSNTINLLGGLFAPALVFGVLGGRGGLVSMVWLLGLTLAVVGLGLWRGRLTRPDGALVIGIYAAFVIYGISAGG